MCQVSMNGLPAEREIKEVDTTKRMEEGVAHSEMMALPRHSLCIGKRGTGTYFCRCVPPFVEDVSITESNCLLQIGSCDSKLCIHGTCVTTANGMGQAVCMCYTGYTGPQCNQKVCIFISLATSHNFSMLRKLLQKK